MRDLTSSLWGFNELYFTMLDSAKSKSFRALQERFVIINYDILEKFEQHITSDDVGHFIIDECHRIKDRFSGRAKVLQRIIDKYPDAKITMLSGTVIPNRFNDLFNYFKIGHHPLGESYKKFTDEYTLKTASRGGEKITGAKNIQDLKSKMMNFMLIKKMSDCFDMPEDVISRYTFDFDDYREDYNKIIEEMAKEKNMAALRGHVHSINIITSKAKMKGIIEVIEEIVSDNGKCVVFGSYKEPLAILEAHFGDRAVKVDGSVNSYDRDRYKREFWDNPKIEVFLGNYLAAGEALDLSCASDVVHINFPMTPREIRQAQFRCKHPEKKGHLRIHYTFAKESIDEHIYNTLLLSKERDINALMTNGEQVIEMENIEEILIKKLLNKENLDDLSYDFSKKAIESNEEAIVEEKNAIKDSVQPSFEEMTSLVNHVEDNKSQFIHTPVTNPMFEDKTIFPDKKVGNITQEEINKNWEHVKKTKDSIPKGDCMASQLEAVPVYKPISTKEDLKEAFDTIASLPPPPSFL